MISLKKIIPIKNKTVLRTVYTVIAFLVMLLIWQVLSLIFSARGVIPSPLATFGLFFESLAKGEFYKAVFSSVSKALIAFIAAFLLGAALAFGAAVSERVRLLASPCVSVLRAVPTLGVTFILFMLYPGGVAAMIIGAMIALPVTYSNLLSVLEGMDFSILEMARAYKIPPLKKLTGIYIPSVLPGIFASLKAGLGLTLKVILAAEVIAVPRTSIGGNMSGAFASANFTALAMWVITAIIINFICEGLIVLAEYFAMPYKRSR